MTLAMYISDGQLIQRRYINCNGYLASEGSSRMIEFGELERNEDETVVAYFKLLPRGLTAQTQQKQKHRPAQSM